MDELRRTGLAKMKEVYGWDMPDVPGDYYKYTVEHLFGTIWTRPGLTQRDRRLLLLGAVSAMGLDDILQIQITAALANGELSDDELREVALFLTHYVGWPLGQKVYTIAEKAIAKKAATDGGDDAGAE
ncbi:MAG: carboxymuconolactone decarboxylase family protein [Actinobacteria bacterium]|nr:carboxymuconolactone decarboxylase family protein [Actinomycetota bacterium]